MIINNFLHIKNITKISDKDIIYLNSHTLDPLGRVFKYKDKIYRGIYIHKKKYFEELWESGLLQELMSLNLIPKCEVISNLKHHYYSIIVKHEKIRYTDPTLWTFSMFKDASITLLRVNEICNKYGYELNDAHPYNLSFKGTYPVFIDLGSIVKKVENTWKAKAEFVIFTLLPLILIQHGYISEAYMFLYSILPIIRLSFWKFEGTLMFQKFVGIMNSLGINDVFSYNYTIDFLESLKPVEFANTDTIWSHYYTEEEISKLDEIIRNPLQTRFKRFVRVAEIISKYIKEIN
jgi:hypothetical protein